MPEMRIAEKLLPLLEKQKRFKIAIGGRGSGKSQTMADLLLMKAQTERCGIGMFREFQNSIDESSYSLLISEIINLKLQGFEWNNNKIHHKDGGSFSFKGLARNAESIKSMHGFKYFFVEEAQTISKKSLEILTPTLRTTDSEIWMAGNPRSSADPFSQRFIVPYQKELFGKGYYEDDLHLIVMVNYCDNPFFPEVLEKERARDEKALSQAEYAHIWLGQFNDEVAGSIIPVEWFNAAIDSHVKLGIEPVGAIVAAHDPSDEGPDPKGYALRHGIVIKQAYEYDGCDVNTGCNIAVDAAMDSNADLFIYDGDGMGAALKQPIHERIKGKKIEAVMFKGSQAPDSPEAIYQPVENESKAKHKTNRQTFRNKRAQYYWRLRDRFYNTYQAVTHGKYMDPDNLISLSSDIKDLDLLRSQVCRIPKKPNNSGLIQIMSKLDMEKMEISSPNAADALMMTMEVPDLAATNFKPVNFAGWR